MRFATSNVPSFHQQQSSKFHADEMSEENRVCRKCSKPLFPLYTEERFSYTENKLFRFADDSTLVAVVPSTGEREAVAESLKRDRNRVGMWCDFWVMKLYASKTKTMIVSRSRIIRKQSTPLTLDGTVLNV